METTNTFFGIDEYMERFSRYIKRHEARVLAQGYVVGLMMDGDRKSVEPLSEKVHASERGMQGSEPVSNEYFTGIHGMGSWRFRASMERLRLEIREALLPMHVRLHKNSSVYIQGTKS